MKLNSIATSGAVKIPVKAFHNFGLEFIIYETNFGDEKFEDVYAGKLWILNSPPGYTAAGIYTWTFNTIEEIGEGLYVFVGFIV